jgi:hypothetical protein
MHLTNYSLNKKNDKYVRCDDPDIEDYGNKWSMSALLRFLKSQGKDTFNLMMQIEETIIKTLLSVESPLASAARMFIPFKGNCFGKIYYLLNVHKRKLLNASGREFILYTILYFNLRNSQFYEIVK